MSHDTPLEAHEHAEHAHHAAHAADPFVSRVSITVAFLAVMAATAGSLETVEGGRAITFSSEAVLAQNKATDAWNEYQADSLKRHLYEIASDTPGLHAGAYRQDAKEEKSNQAKVRATALEDEAERDRLMRESAAREARHHWLTGSATLIEIGIALSTIAIITRRKTFWIGAIGLGMVGAALFAVAYLA